MKRLFHEGVTAASAGCRNEKGAGPGLVPDLRHSILDTIHSFCCF
jgi:hypothetical protein